MEVYIEYVIIDNFIIDMLILLFTCLVLGSSYSKSRLVLSTLIGVTGAVIMPFITPSTYLMIILKLLLGVVMVLTLRKYCSFANFFAHLMLFFTLTFVFGGLCYGLCIALGESTLGILINAYELPMGFIVLIVSVYIYLLWKLLLYVRHKNKNISLYYDVVLMIEGEKHYIRGYIDSGNSMYDNGKPVVVLSFGTFCKIFKKFPYQNLLLCKEDKIPLKNAHFIDFNTASGCDKMLVFDVDEISIKNPISKEESKSEVCIGVAKKSFHQDFDCLLHSEFVKG